MGPPAQKTPGRYVGPSRAGYRTGRVGHGPSRAGQALRAARPMPGSRVGPTPMLDGQWVHTEGAYQLIKSFLK